MSKFRGDLLSSAAQCQ